MDKATRDEILRRSCGVCENCYSGAGAFQFAHILHRRMGGRHGEMAHIINEAPNVAYLCVKCHDILDGRTPGDSNYMRRKLKSMLGWYKWAESSGVK